MCKGHWCYRQRANGAGLHLLLTVILGVFSCYRLGNWGTGKLSHLPKVTQLVSCGAKNKHSNWVPESVPSTTVVYCIYISAVQQKECPTYVTKISSSHSKKISKSHLNNIFFNPHIKILIISKCINIKIMNELFMFFNSDSVRNLVTYGSTSSFKLPCFKCWVDTHGSGYATGQHSSIQLIIGLFLSLP